MKTILFEKWNNHLSIVKLNSGYLIKGLQYWSTNSHIGKSQGNVKCPCCGAVTVIYLWSFAGCGKRCSNCNVLLGYSGAFVDIKEIKSDLGIKILSIDSCVKL